MEKNGKNSSELKNGLLSRVERGDIRRGRLSPKVKTTLTNQKNGKFTKKLALIVDDIELVLTNEITKDMLSNYKSYQQLDRLRDILDRFFDFSPIPTYRISATVKSGTKKRVFELAKINYGSSEESIEQIRSSQLTRGLKDSERTLIQNYTKVRGYNFPLELGKQYSWNEVKTLINKELKKTNLGVPKSEKEKARESYKLAWNMIRENIDEKRKTEILDRTGFWIQLKQYSGIK